MLGDSHEEKENTGTNHYNTCWSPAPSESSKDGLQCRQCDESFSSKYHLQQHVLAEHNKAVLAQISGLKRPRSPENSNDVVKSSKKSLTESPSLQPSLKLDVNSNKRGYALAADGNIVDGNGQFEHAEKKENVSGQKQTNLPPHLQLAASMSHGSLDEKYLSQMTNHGGPEQDSHTAEGPGNPMVSLMKAFQNHPSMSPAPGQNSKRSRSPYVNSPLGSDGNFTDHESRDDASSVSSLGGNSVSLEGQDTKVKKNRRSSIDDGHVKEIYKCTLCNKIFRQSGNFHNHMKTHSEVSKFCKCGICGLDFDCSENLQVHMRSEHTGTNPYKCEHCDREFSQYNNLRRHLRVHREKIFKCKLCDRQFNEEFYLTMHMGTHTGHRVYSCGVCNACFPSNHDLKNHVKTHSLSELHVCDVCGKAFSKACVLRQHKKAHSGERPYKCDTCPKTFIHRHHLTMHMRSHTESKPFTCEICGKVFTQSSHLYKHVRQHEDGTLDSGELHEVENQDPATAGAAAAAAKVDVSHAISKDLKIPVQSQPSGLPQPVPPVKRRRRSKTQMKQQQQPQQQQQQQYMGSSASVPMGSDSTTLPDHPKMSNAMTPISHPYGMFPPAPQMSHAMYRPQIPLGVAPEQQSYDQFYQTFLAQAQAQAYYNNMYMANMMAQAKQAKNKDGQLNIPSSSSNSSMPSFIPNLPMVNTASLKQPADQFANPSIASGGKFSLRQESAAVRQAERNQAEVNILNLSVKQEVDAQDLSADFSSKSKSLSTRSEEIPLMPSSIPTSTSSSSSSSFSPSDVQHMAVNHSQPSNAPHALDLRHHMKSSQDIPPTHYIHGSTVKHIPSYNSTVSAHHHNHHHHEEIAVHIPKPPKSVQHETAIPSLPNQVQSHFQSVQQHMYQSNPYPHRQASPTSQVSPSSSLDWSSKQTKTNPVISPAHLSLSNVPLQGREMGVNQSHVFGPGQEKQKISPTYLADGSHQDSTTADGAPLIPPYLSYLKSYPSQHWLSYHGHQGHCLGNQYLHEDEEVQDLSAKVLHRGRAEGQSEPEDLSSRSSRQTTPTELTMSREGTPTSQLLRETTLSGGCMIEDQNQINPCTVEVSAGMISEEADDFFEADGKESIDVVSCDTTSPAGETKVTLSENVTLSSSTVKEGQVEESDDIRKLRKKIAAVKKLLNLEGGKGEVSTVTDMAPIKDEREVCTSTVEDVAPIEDSESYTEMAADDSYDELAEKRLEIVEEVSDDEDQKMSSTTEQEENGCNISNENDSQSQSQIQPQSPSEEAPQEGYTSSKAEENAEQPESFGIKQEKEILLIRCDFCLATIEGEASVSEHMTSSVSCFQSLCESVGLRGISEEKGRKLLQMYQTSLAVAAERPKPSDHQPDSTQPAESVEPSKTLPLISNVKDIPDQTVQLSCGVCWKVFETEELFKTHQTEHVTMVTNPSNACHVCDEKFVRPFDLQFHLINHHQQRDATLKVDDEEKRSRSLSPTRDIKGEGYSCKICGETFKQLKFYKDHLDTHTGARPYKCNECGRGFSYKHNLNRHMMSHNTKSYSCEVCGRSFKETFYLHMHMKIHAEEKNRRCEICGQHIPKSDLWQHMLAHLGSSEKNPTYEQIGERVKEILKEQNKGIPNELSQNIPKIISKALNGTEPFSQNPLIGNSLEQFSNIVTLAEQGKLSLLNGPGPVEENQSMDLSVSSSNSLGYTAETEMLRRISIGSEEVENIGKLTTKLRDTGSHTCHICNQVFKTKREFGNHLGVHNGERTHICKECGKGFKKSCILRQHEKIHTGKRPYKCEECGGTFLHYHHLQIHARVHNGERPYKCHVCGMGFKHSSNLPKHLKSHEPGAENQSEINECDGNQYNIETGFLHSEGLSAHMEDDDGNQTPDHPEPAESPLSHPSSIPEFPGIHAMEIVNSA